MGGRASLADRVAAAWTAFAQRRFAPAVLVTVAVALVTPCLTLGFVADDFLQLVRLDPNAAVPGFEYAPWRLFDFAGGDAGQVARARDSGVLSWWAPDTLRLGFWRPVTVLTHRLDRALWPGNAALMYAHSIAWLALLLVATARLYRRLAGPAALLALAVFAFEDAHAPAVGFIANRNAVIAATFGVLALLAHDRWRRDGWRPGAVVGPLAFGTALLAGEAGVAAAAYLAAHAAFVDPAPLRHRWRALVPYVLLGVVWVAFYGASGFGAHDSGVYVDPGGEPVRFLSAFIERAPVLALGQLGGPWSDFWLLYPPRIRPVIWGGGVAAVILLAVLVRPVLRRSAELRFWTLGATLSIVPIAGTFPADRLLVFVSLGVAPLLAALIADLRERRAGHRALAGLLVFLHLIAAPLLVPVRARSMDTVANAARLIDEAVPETDVAGETLVVVNAPNDGLVGYLLLRRAALGDERPDRLRLLTTTAESVHVARLDERSLALRVDGGMLASEGERLLRSPLLTFEPGDRVDAAGVRYTVTATTEDGRPEGLLVRFDAPLEDPTFRFVAFVGDRFVPFEPPAQGGETTIAPVDLEALSTRLLTGE